MAKRYIKIPFQNSPSTATPLSAEFLNPILDALDACDTEIENKQSISNMIQTILNDTTKYVSSAVIYALNQIVTGHTASIQSLNDKLTNLDTGYIATTDATWQTDILNYLKNTVKVNSSFKLAVAFVIGSTPYAGYVEGCKLNQFNLYAEFKYSQSTSPYFVGYRINIIGGVQFGWVGM